jgi:inner membrane protein
VDGVTYLVSADMALQIRRGWTHGIAAILVWPIILAGSLVLLDRILGSNKARFPALLSLSLLAVATHPSLDWVNNYGMRWLMPFGPQWFYGDTLLIVDPWIWLGLGGAVFLATSRGTANVLLWLVLAGAAIFLVWNGPFEFFAGKLIFVSGVTFFAFLRTRGLPRTVQGMERLQRGALAFALIYVLSMVAIAVTARRLTLGELRRYGIEVESLMVGPMPMTPLTKDVVVKTPDNYRFGTFSFWPSTNLVLADETLPRMERSSIVTRALARPEVRGFANWARFPWAEVIEEPEGDRVIFRDARYIRSREPNGFGAAVVFLPRLSDP